MVSVGHILLVDDEPGIVAALRPALRAAGHTVTVASDGNAALGCLLAGDADVVLLDLGLPDMDGKDVIRSMRPDNRTPIIVISARHQETEKIAALDLGADDYVDKPFVLDVLLARVRSALRRREGQVRPAMTFEAGPLMIDYATHAVHLNGNVVKLSPKEYKLLKALAESAGQLVTQRRLLGAGWGRSDTDPQYLRVYMAMLRQKLETNPADPDLILTEPGVGYRLSVGSAVIGE